MKTQNTKHKIIAILALATLLSGCPLDGDKGATGASGLDGINCWDLNEDGLKTMPSEDTNLDGVIDVLDCRVSHTPAQGSSIVVDPNNQTITQTHRRTAYSTSIPGSLIRLYSGTSIDYQNAFGNWSLLDPYVVDPVEDPCGLWKWSEMLPSGDYSLYADGALEYDVEHFARVAVTNDPNEPAHFGYDACTASCLADESCVGAIYSGVSFNTIICKRLLKPARTLGRESSFEAFSTPERGFAVANLGADPTTAGLVSVCESP
jgi:hypothetical protein